MPAALIVVDVQRDFCPGGALPVHQGDRIVPVLNQYLERFTAAGWPIIASRDWHPTGSAHFAGYGGRWPVHCVQHTPGAAFHPDLRLPPSAIVASKGQSRSDEGYSAFEGRIGDGQQALGDVLRERAVDTVYVGGLATDYCVQATVLDALHRGLTAVLLLDASRGVNVDAGDAETAIEAMVRAGAEVTTLERLDASRFQQ